MGFFVYLMIFIVAFIGGILGTLLACCRHDLFWREEAKKYEKLWMDAEEGLVQFSRQLEEAEARLEKAGESNG